MRRLVIRADADRYVISLDGEQVARPRVEAVLSVNVPGGYFVAMDLGVDGVDVRLDNLEVPFRARANLAEREFTITWPAYLERRGQMSTVHWTELVEIDAPEDALDLLDATAYDVATRILGGLVA